MRTARKLVLLATMTAAALALTASSASAAITITNEAAGGAECGTVTTAGHTVSGGCLVHAVSEDNAVITAHLFGVEFTDSVCQNEFTARIGTNGAGWIYNQVLVASPSCGREACEASGERVPWQATGVEVGPGNEDLNVVFCLQNLDGSGASTCTIAVDITQVGHAQEFSANDKSCAQAGPPQVELTGHWRTEGSRIEIAH